MQTPYMDISCSDRFTSAEENPQNNQQEQTATTSQEQKPMTKKQQRKQEQQKKKEEKKQKKEEAKKQKAEQKAAKKAQKKPFDFGKFLAFLKKLLAILASLAACAGIIACITKCFKPCCKCDCCSGKRNCLSSAYNSTQYETCLVVSQQNTYKVACVGMAQQCVYIAQQIANKYGCDSREIIKLAQSGYENPWQEWSNKCLRNGLAINENIVLDTRGVQAESTSIAASINQKLGEDPGNKKKQELLTRINDKISLFNTVDLSVKEQEKCCKCCPGPNKKLEDECEILFSLLGKLNNLHNFPSDKKIHTCCGTCCGKTCYINLACCCNTSCCFTKQKNLLDEIQKIISTHITCGNGYGFYQESRNLTTTDTRFVTSGTGNIGSSLNDETVSHGNIDSNINGYNRSALGSRGNLGGHNGSLQSSNHNISNVI